MTIFSSNYHHKHDIICEIYNGKYEESAEKPKRIDNILKEIKRFTVLGQVIEIKDELILQVHSLDYVNFLKQVQDSNFDKIYPSIYNYSSFLDIKPTKIEILAGNYLFDSFTPCTNQIWTVAKESASLAISACNHTLKTGKNSYALCRPPGHHATKNMAGGYCYLANASLVAQNLLNLGKKPCILDIDYHHGNGAQEIWYQSNKVLTISIHRDPSDKFPYYSGFENEKGQNLGIGWNYNLPLPKETKESEYLKKLEEAIEIIITKECDYLVISAGFDTYKKDPICDFKLEMETYKKIAEVIKKVNLPIIILQEGGYYLQDLGKCASTFLENLIN